MCLAIKKEKKAAWQVQIFTVQFHILGTTEETSNTEAHTEIVGLLPKSH